MNTVRTIEQIINPPEAHWVGTGFRVRQYFPNGDNSPLLQRMSPFILLDYNEPYYFQGTPFDTGVSPHPHKGFETATFVFSGTIAHRDTAGNSGIIGAGDVQWMTAGSGVLHKEYHEKESAKRGRMLHAIQLWVNLPAADKETAPAYQSLQSGQMGRYVSLDETVTATVYAGTFRTAKGPARTHTPMNVYKLTLTPHANISVSESGAWNTGFLVINGSGTANESTPIRTNQFIILGNDGDRFELTADEDGLEVFILSGKPIDEPVVKNGPFVMTDGTELLLAYSAYMNGQFGREEDLM